MLKKEPAKLKCQKCGNEFGVQPYRALTAKYCSYSCSQSSKTRAKNIAARGTGTVGYVKQMGRHQHRVVAENKIGRPLLRSEIVHHKDGNKHNNHPDNLEVMTQSNHIKLHHRMMTDIRVKNHRARNGS